VTLMSGGISQQSLRFKRKGESEQSSCTPSKTMRLLMQNPLVLDTLWISEPAKAPAVCKTGVESTSGANNGRKVNVKKRIKSKGPISTQEDVDAHRELGRMQLEEQLYEPKEEIEGVDTKELESQRQRLLKGLGKLQINHMMLIRGSDRPVFYKWKSQHPRMKFVTKTAGIPVVVNAIMKLDTLKMPKPTHKDTFVIVKRIA
jgi:hypothetical protein